MKTFYLTFPEIQVINDALKKAFVNSYSISSFTARDPLTDDLVSIKLSITASGNSIHVSASWGSERVERSFPRTFGEMRSTTAKAIVEFIENGGKDNNTKQLSKDEEVLALEDANKSGFKCIDIVEHYSYNIGSAIKYIWFRKIKDDYFANLQKAIWYLNRAIKNNEEKLDYDLQGKSGSYSAFREEPVPIYEALLRITSKNSLAEAVQILEGVINSGKII